MEPCHSIRPPRRKVIAGPFFLNFFNFSRSSVELMEMGSLLWYFLWLSVTNRLHFLSLYMSVCVRARAHLARLS